MCGIVGILGAHEVAPLILEALKRLEYRGYDSAGIATVDAGRLDLRRTVGKLINLSDRLVRDPLPGRSGIGHTRWATHGAPTVANAHPHRAGPVAVVHNGIIENHAALRAGLPDLDSETDTEVVAALVAQRMAAGAGPQSAVEAVLPRLEGAFALAFLFEDHPDLMIGARRGSPLAVGYGDGEMFLGSDAIALAPMTDRISYLEEGDIAVLTRAGVTVYAEGVPVVRPVRTVRADAAAHKDGYRHWMAKEIAEQPAVLALTLGRYLDGNSISLPAATPDFATIDRIVMIACGTAHYACLVAKYWFEGLARVPVEVDVASEFRYRAPPLGPGVLAIVVSQSGETADTLAALRYCTAHCATLSVTNVAESSIARTAGVDLPILAGVEIGVASTKAFTCQLTVLALLALHAAARRDMADIAPRLDELRRLPALMAQALTGAPQAEAIAQDLSSARDILFMGRGAMYPMALEGALKLKEVSYIHAEGHAAGELKHGPIALIDDAVPMIVMAPRDALHDKTLSNAAEVMARGGRVVAVSDAPMPGAWRRLDMPTVPALIAPMVYAVPAQLLAYHTAIAKGTDVDQPRNLAKSVTVE